MPIEITCDGCGSKLRVPDEHAGKQARCPNCQAIQPIPANPAAPPTVFPEIQTYPPPPIKDSPAESFNPYASPPATTSPYTPVSTYGTYGQKRWTKPHRGGTILTLGILALCCNFCFIPGIVAWNMGSTDLKEIDAGVMDPSGRGTTQAGMILGIVGTIISVIGVVFQIMMSAQR